MTTNQTPVEETSVVRINLNGELHRIKLSESSSAADLRAILAKRHDLRNNTSFLDNKGCQLHIDDEMSTTINQLLTEEKFIRLSNETKAPIQSPVLKRQNKISERKLNRNCAEIISPLSKTSFDDLRKPDSIHPSSEHKVILATDLDSNTWKKIFHDNSLLSGIRMDEKSPIRSFDPIFEFKSSDGIYPKVRVDDQSYTRAYMRDMDMQSSFVSSDFFDCEFKFSSYPISIGINEAYFNKKSIVNTYTTN